jgi:aldehyde dehydrogenase (NAD+)
VEEDANIKVAARRIALAKFSNAGQMCVAPDYLLVHKSKKKDFLNALQEAIESFFSPSADASPDYGKIINIKQFRRLKGYLTEGKIVHGGRYDEESLFISPTIIEDVSLSDPIMKEEIFGPILPVISFETQEEALSVIRNNPDPLAFYIYTSSSNREKSWLQAVPFGGGCVNNSSWQLTNYHLPFGGRGNSGIGQYHGKNSFEVFSHRKAIMKTPTWFDPFIKYPPLKGRLKLFKWIVK